MMANSDKFDLCRPNKGVVTSEGLIPSPRGWVPSVFGLADTLSWPEPKYKSHYDLPNFFTKASTHSLTSFLSILPRSLNLA